MSQHVPLPPQLRLEPWFAHVQGYLDRVDPALRIRKSAECFAYVLERRCRRAPATNTGMGNRSDLHVQARDGYIHVALVHPQFMTRPWNIVRSLNEEGFDVWAAGGWERVEDELLYEERWAEESRRRRRRGLYRDIAVDSFDVLNRLGNKDGTERTRISNPGLGTAA